MALFNTPQVQVIADDDHQAVIKITGYYNSGNTSNTVVLVSNTLFGANGSRPCLLAVNAYEYSTSINNGFIALEWVSTVNSNTTIVTSGRFNDGAVNRYIPNNANTPTGDVNMFVSGLASGDSYTLVVSFLKLFTGVTISGNLQGQGSSRHNT